MKTKLLFCPALAIGLGYCAINCFKPLFVEGKILCCWFIILLFAITFDAKSSKRALFLVALALNLFCAWIAPSSLSTVAILALAGSSFAYLSEDRPRHLSNMICAAALVGSFLIYSGSLFRWDDRYGRALVLDVRSLQQRGEYWSYLNLIGAWTAIDIGLLIFAVGVDSRRRQFRISSSTLLALATSLFISIWLLSPLPAIVGTAIVATILSRESFLTLVNQRWKFLLCFPTVGLIFGAILLLKQSNALDLRPHQTIAIGPVGLGLLTNHLGPYQSANLPIEAAFGTLPHWLQDHGWNVKLLRSDWVKSDLASCDVAFFVNTVRPLDPTQQAAIEGFVRTGHRLVVSGDHTNIMGVRDGANLILRFTGMRLRFDSAIPSQGWPEWDKGMWVSPALLGSDLSPKGIGISVGASLALSDSAEPLVVGVEGYGDEGNPANPPGFLGNMQYDEGERRGSVVLAAIQRVGKGTVTAWGDTSSFQDGALVFSYNTVDLTFRLGSPASSILLMICGVGCLLLLGVLTGNPGSLAIGAISIMILGWSLCAHVPLVPPVQSDLIFDTRYEPRYPGKYNEEQAEHFFSLFDRDNQIIMANDSYKSLQYHPHLIVIASPTKTIPSDEAKALLSYAREGGSLLVMSGRDSAPQVSNLLAPLGLHIDSDPIGGPTGSAIVDTQLNQTILSAMTRLPASDQEPFSLCDASEVIGPSDVLATTLSAPTVVRLRLGAGKIVVIGDSRFFTDKSLGAPFRINVADARFLYELITWLSAANK